MTEYVYKLKNGKLISAYDDEKENISITKEALEIMVNSWNEGYLKGRADSIDEYNKKIDYLKNSYVDACGMCTRMECDVCAISNFIEDLEQLKEQNE